MPDLDTAVAEAAQEAVETRNLTVCEYVVVAALTGWDSEGEQVTAVAVIPSDAPNHRLLGLVEAARLRFRQYELDPDE